MGLLVYRQINISLGLILVIWGILDGLINAINSFYLIVFHKRWEKTCLLNYLAYFLLKLARLSHVHGPKDFGTALDVLLSFILVSIAIANNLFNEFTIVEQKIWSVSVILNILYAGSTRIVSSAMRLKKSV